MKRALLILSLFVAATSNAQFQKPIGYGFEYRRLVTDTLFAFPNDTFTVITSLKQYAWAARKGDSIYVWSPLQDMWVLAGGSGGGGGGSNFANTNLTLTANRTHNMNNFTVTFNNNKNWLWDFQADGVSTFDVVDTKGFFFENEGNDGQFYNGWVDWDPFFAELYFGRGSVENFIDLNSNVGGTIASILLKAKVGSQISAITIYDDSLAIDARLGQMYIESMRMANNDTAGYKPMVYNINNKSWRYFNSWGEIGLGGGSNISNANLTASASHSFNLGGFTETITGGKWVHDSVTFTNTIIYSAFDSLIAFGDSYTNPGSNASTDSSYISRYKTRLGVVLDNQGVSGRGAWQAAANSNLNEYPGHTKMATILAGFNDIRRGGSDARTYNKVINATKNLFINHFLQSYQSAGTGANVTRYGTWTATYPASTIGGKSVASGAYTLILNDSIVYTFTNDNVVFTPIFGDGTTEIYSNSIEIYIDGVLQTTYNSNFGTDAISDGADGNTRQPGGFIFTGLPYTSHKIKLINKQNTKAMIVDYFGHLVALNASYPLVIFHAPKIDATGYATAPANANDAKINSLNVKLDSLAATFPTGYPVYVAPTNSYYTNTTASGDLDVADHIHPTNQGHRHIYDAAVSVFGAPITTTGLARRLFWSGDRPYAFDNTNTARGLVYQGEAATVAGSNHDVQINNSGSFGVATGFTANNTNNLVKIESPAVGNVNLLLKGFAAQTADQFQVLSSAGALLYKIDAGGGDQTFGALANPTGSGSLEREFLSGISYLTSYNRGGSSYLPLNLRASIVNVAPSGSTKVAIDATATTISNDIVHSALAYNSGASMVGVVQDTLTGKYWRKTASGGSGTPSAPTNSVQYNNASSFGGSANLTYDAALLTSLSLALGTTQDDTKGIVVSNTTAAALGAQQISPAVRYSAQGWSTSGSVNTQVEFRSYVVPVQGTTATGYYTLESSIAGAAYVELWKQYASNRIEWGTGVTRAGDTYSLAMNGSTALNVGAIVFSQNAIDSGSNTFVGAGQNMVLRSGIVGAASFGTDGVMYSTADYGFLANDANKLKGESASVFGFGSEVHAYAGFGAGNQVYLGSLSSGGGTGNQYNYEYGIGSNIGTTGDNVVMLGFSLSNTGATSLNIGQGFTNSTANTLNLGMGATVPTLILGAGSGSTPGLTDVRGVLNVVTSATIPIVNGSTSASGNLQLQSTSNGTKGKIDVLDSVNFNGRTIEKYSAKYNDQTGTSYTLIAADNGKILTFDNGSDITLTIPAGLPAGFTCTVVQLGAGEVVFTASSTTLHNRSSFTKTGGQYAVAAITQYASNVFIFGGDCQ